MDGRLDDPVRRVWRPVFVWGVVSFTAWVGAARGSEYLNYAALTARLHQMAAAHPDACYLTSAGVSREGRELWVLRLGRGDGLAGRSAMMVLGGVDGDYPVSSATAVAVAEVLLSGASGGADLDDESSAIDAETPETGGDVLDRYVVYVLPCANPDGMERYFDAPQVEHRANLRPWDDDRDGAVDEDGPEDLNCDGLITQMRVVDPEGTFLPDPAEPRLLKVADRAKGDRPVYKVYTEGVDTDEDGSFNEDGPGGVDINRNFMHGYREHAPGVGPYQISEPESRAVIEFFLSHPHIAASVVYGRCDNLVQVPEGGKKDATKRAPVGLHAGDVGVYKQISERYKALTGLKTPVKEPADGAVFAWAYAQYGIPSFACRVWGRPRASKAESEAGGEGGGQPDTAGKAGEGATPSAATGAKLLDVPAEGGGEAVGPAGSAAGDGASRSGVESSEAGPAPAREPKRSGKRHRRKARSDDGAGANVGAGTEGQAVTRAAVEPAAETTSGGADVLAGQSSVGGADLPGSGTKDADGSESGAKKIEPSDKEAAGWLEYSDEQRDGAGFVPWEPFDHPQLGRVEIGGFAPFFRTTPPAARIAEIADKQTAFVRDLLGRLPRLRFAAPSVKRLSALVFQVETRLVNDGYFPTALAIAKENRRVRPIVVRLDVPPDRVLAGDRIVKVWSVDGGGGVVKFKWVVVGEPGATVRVRAESEKYGALFCEAELSFDSVEGSVAP